MSVFVEGVQAAVRCKDCRFAMPINNQNPDRKLCVLLGQINLDSENSKLNNCPVHELPPVHGRLVDAVALEMKFKTAAQTGFNEKRNFCSSFQNQDGTMSTEWWCVDDMLDNTPTIISSEGMEDDNNE